MLRLTCLSLSLLISMSLAACDIGKLTVGTTAKVLVRAQPSLEQESDWEMASRAIPGTLKTVEGFHFVDPENERLTKILAQGYCQYGTGFIEDEFEQAEGKHDFDAMNYHAQRATKAYFRCMNYSLDLLGSGWKKAIVGDLDGVKRQAAATGQSNRDALMWAAIGLASAINYNRDDIQLIANLPKARVMIERVVELDEKHPDTAPQLRALPLIALGMMHTALSPAMGGKPDLAAKYFQRAIEVTNGRFLLAKVLYARRYAVATQDRALFRKTLIEVLQTDPAIWPQQRLANEIAHRRARRYLKREKEWF
jgi:hypothetical protein